MDSSIFLHLEIKSVAQKNLLDGDYDGAIYDAMCLIEKKLQEIGNTKSINTKLVDEIFDNGLLKVSDDSDRNFGARELFLGAFRIIRNDRGHHKSTTQKFEISCENEEDCMKYLGFISLLLIYIDRNLKNKPLITSLKMGSRLELIGDNFTQNSQVIIDNLPVDIITITNNKIEVERPLNEKGFIQVRENGLLSEKKEYFFPKKGDVLYREIIATKIPLYSDKECTTQLVNIFGVKYIVHEIGGNFYKQISPTTCDYKVGDYITNEWGNEGWNESWYKDPTQAGKIRYAWTSSLEITGKVAGKKGVMKAIKLEIRPGEIISGVDETRGLQAILIESDGYIFKESNVTNSSKWKTNNSCTLIEPKKGILRTKSLGESLVECTCGALHDSIKIKIVSPLAGLVVKYHFSHLKRYQQIRFDSKNNLYISDQSDKIHCVSSNGELNTIVVLPEYDDPKYGVSDFKSCIDCLAIDGKDQLLFTCLRPNRAYSLNQGRLDTLISPSPAGIMGTFKGIDRDDSVGSVFIADMAGRILKVNKDKTIDLFTTKYTPIFLRVLNNNTILVIGDGMLKLHKMDETGIKTSEVLWNGGIVDFVIKGKLIYIGTWQGEIYEIRLGDKKHKQKIAEGLGHIGGIDMSSSGDLYVSIFDENPENTGIYKIYL